MDEELIYSKTITEESNNRFVTKNAHVVKVHNMSNGSIAGYVATSSIIYYQGWMGFDTRSQSFVFDNEEEAIAFCEEYFDGKKESK